MFLELVFCTLLTCADTQTEVVRDIAQIQYFTASEKQILKALEVTGHIIKVTTSKEILTDTIELWSKDRPEQLEWGRYTVSKGSHPY